MAPLIVALVLTWLALLPASVQLRAVPVYGFAPITIRLSAMVTGPDEALYCVAETWDFGDGETSEAVPDCLPYQPGDDVRHYYERRHTFVFPGDYVARLTLRRGERVIASGTVTVRALGSTSAGGAGVGRPIPP